MKYIVNSEEMSAIDRYTSEVIGIPSIVLMEKASIKMACFLLAKIDRHDRIIAVCGTGNNGGDGAATARILFQKGYQVDILVAGNIEKMSEQMKIQVQIAKNLGMSVLNSAKISEYTIVIDAMFGVGLKRPVTGVFAEIISEINEAENTVFSVDLPSGISADTGKILNIAVKADYTVTFGYTKFGLLVYPGCGYAGETVTADIGFPKMAGEKISSRAFLYEKEDLSKLPSRNDYSNKGTYGKVLVIAGSENISGACYLSAKAAYRIGAGLVKVLTHEKNRTVIGTLLPEALLSDYTEERLQTEEGIKQIQKEIEWSDVIVIGPGIGTSKAAVTLMEIVLAEKKVPVVMDADAVNLLSEKRKISKDAFELPEQVILTPHLKEMSRLINRTVSEIAENLLETAENFTKDKKLVLALKDTRTVVSDGEKLYLNVSGNHGMATGGSGDVLSGIIGGLLAQGMELFDAAALGVYIHGLAGNYAAEEKNCYSLMASDIIDAISFII